MQILKNVFNDIKSDSMLTVYTIIFTITLFLTVAMIYLFTSLSMIIDENNINTTDRVDYMSAVQSSLVYNTYDLEDEISDLETKLSNQISTMEVLQNDLESINITLLQAHTDTLNQSRIEYTQSEFKTLCMLVQHEAGGESQLCRLMVASVIINRVNDTRYPNNLNDVIFDTNGGLQFSPSLNLYKTPSDDTIAAVAEALRYDLSGGAWIFNNKDYTSESMQSWFDKYELVIEVDGVQFRK